MSDNRKNKGPKLSDPAYMKTEEEIEAQLAYVKLICKRVSIVMGIAIILLLLGFFFF